MELKLEKLVDKFWLLLILAFSIPAVWALFVPGFYGASDDLHIGWLYEMDRAIQSGQFPPRFVPDLSFGFGYPLFNFVFPLPFYLGEIFHKLGFSLVDSVKSVFLISLISSALAMYFLLKEFTTKLLSLAGALIYLYTPYRATDVYVRGAIGESLAFVFPPLILLSVYKICTRKSDLSWVGAGVLSITGLILSHNIATYIFLPFIIALAIFLFLIKPERQLLLRFALMLFLSLSAASYFWIPVLVDSGLMKYDTVFDFRDHFPTLIQLIKPFFGYGASVPGPYDGMSFFIGSLNILLIVLAGVGLIKLRKKYSFFQKTILIWSLITLTVVVFMMNYRSTFLWQHIPFLPYFQFPWRFLMMTTFVTPLLVIGLEGIKFKQQLAVFLMLGAVFLKWSYFRPHDFLGRTDSYYLNRYIPYPEASEDYKQTQEEYLRLPRLASKRPDKNFPLVITEDNSKVDINKVNSLHQIITISTSSSQLINYNKYNFPGWGVKVNGQKQELGTGQPFGQITFSIPAGTNKVEVYFTETRFKLFLDIMSLSAILVSLGFLINTLSIRKKHDV